ncbi:hypothetical protein [Bradyrhizobium diazoefficiens]|uniref:hypothetical protein n=1 Tax=Bradyrhizobium diazoefficiens TaxID=1355477 RepID=UPI001AEBE3A9|nr:hypothetical protein [Bradyrhizobium diazoefficiens]
MAIDQDAAQTHFAHLAERDLERPAIGVRLRVASDRARHAAIEAGRRPESNYQSLGPRNAREILPAVGVDKQAAGPLPSVDPSQRLPVVHGEPLAMSPSDEPGPHREAPEPKPSRVEEARRIIEEYADDLREIIRKLRRHLN